MNLVQKIIEVINSENKEFEEHLKLNQGRIIKSLATENLISEPFVHQCSLHHESIKVLKESVELIKKT